MASQSIDFISNDFLGFAGSSMLQQAVQDKYLEIVHSYPKVMQGSTGSRRIVGGHPFQSILEEKIAKYHGFESAVIAHCGYMANLSLCYLVSEVDDVMLWDEGVHVSIREGSLIISGKQESFLHNDMEHLEKLLIKYREKGCNRIFIFISTVYSSDGSLAPLNEVVALSKKYEALLIFDEAHALGIHGCEGKGFGSEDFRKDVYAVLVTYGKSFGGFGAAILSSKIVREDIMEKGTPIMFSTALPLHALVVIDRAYEHFKTFGNSLRKQIFNLRNYFSSFVSDSSPGCVQSIRFSERQHALDWVEALKEHNIQVGIFESESVSSVRINLHAFNSYRDIDTLFRVVENLLEKGRCRIDVDHKLHFSREFCVK
ncbi:aminotransferase class I/II-fold pyridoxal phosphate-dependent enzyme [Chlamydiifrater phoenicopteri]|uniref:aminotransferase class I/II-fold pyridoxal phosphate-dependent enzyme n=1 Tax=Chlamydiifrater phoenicopteri TaxID=2681469 RepID=UPI001BD08B44|nr:aminotransferase class I/II-fold pyridoxal phosphate-dependent enzyme [Chlamydiifrater phoenicopteri]